MSLPAAMPANSVSGAPTGFAAWTRLILLMGEISQCLVEQLIQIRYSHEFVGRILVNLLLLVPSFTSSFALLTLKAAAVSCHHSA